MPFEVYNPATAPTLDSDSAAKVNISTPKRPLKVAFATRHVIAAHIFRRRLQRVGNLPRDDGLVIDEHRGRILVLMRFVAGCDSAICPKYRANRPEPDPPAYPP